MTSALFFSAMLVAAHGRPELTGTVTDVDGFAVPHAVVMIYEAQEPGVIPCHSAHHYPDCRKQTLSDDAGAFRVPSLDPDLLFRVLVLEDSFEPLFAELVDPAAGPLKLVLRRRTLTRLRPQYLVRGRVLDWSCRPVAGATLTLVSGRTAVRRPGQRGEIDRVVVTNSTGDFVVTSSRPILDVVYAVKARGFAPRLTAKLAPDRFSHIVTVSSGATVMGRIVHQGRPVAGVTVGLRPLDHGDSGLRLIASDQSGWFRFDDVPCRREYHVFAAMRTINPLGSVAVRQVQLDHSGDAVDLGELQVVPGNALQGRVLSTNQTPLPPGAKLVISCTTTGDTLTCPLRPDGRFSVRGLPTSGYTIRVRAAGNPWLLRPAPSRRTPWSFPAGGERNLATLAISLDPADAIPWNRRQLAAVAAAPGSGGTEPVATRLAGFATPSTANHRIEHP